MHASIQHISDYSFQYLVISIARQTYSILQPEVEEMAERYQKYNIRIHYEMKEHLVHGPTY